MLDKKIIEIKGQLTTLKEHTQGVEKHPVLSSKVYEEYENKLSEYTQATEQFVKDTTKFKEDIVAEIDKQLMALRNKPDCVLEAINKYFEIGPEDSYEQLIRIAQEGEYRFKEQIPPGYEDETKIGLQKYGDLFVWKEILNYASKTKKDFVYVINDVKSDWFEKDQKTPRFELLKEFNGQSEKSIWLLTMSDFIRRVNHSLDNNAKLNATIINDIKSIQENKIFNSPALTLDMVQELFNDLSCNNIIESDVYLLEEMLWNKLELHGRKLTEMYAVTSDLFEPHVYEAVDENGIEYRIVATVIGSSTRLDLHHYFSNTRFIHRRFEKSYNKRMYYHILIAKNSLVLKRLLRYIRLDKEEIGFDNPFIRIMIAYITDDGLNIIKTNFSSVKDDISL